MCQILRRVGNIQGAAIDGKQTQALPPPEDVTYPLAWITPSQNADTQVFGNPALALIVVALRAMPQRNQTQSKVKVK